jgi:hypothetical protein
MTPKKKQKALVDEGVAGTMDEAAHMLVDMGEIDSVDHADLLSDEERVRIYGQ